MTHLRRPMQEELQRRNDSEITLTLLLVPVAVVLDLQHRAQFDQQGILSKPFHRLEGLFRNDRASLLSRR
jgi:hypothetical protein